MLSFPLCRQQCPTATLDAGSVNFTNAVPKDACVSDYLKEQCPCRRWQPTSPTPSTLKLLLILHPIYGWEDVANRAVFGEKCLVKLPNIYAGAQAYITMNHPHTQDANCCCCLRLDYYLTWSQMRVYGYNSRRGGFYIADWINHPSRSFWNRIGHARWNNADCPSTVLHEDSTITSGHAIFETSNFDATDALDKATHEGFILPLKIQFSVTVVVTLSEYCYKMFDAATDCQYSGQKLRGCVYSKPQVVSTLAAGQASYRQMIDVTETGYSRGGGLVSYQVINQDDIKCLEKFTGNATKLFMPYYNFNLNLNIPVTREEESHDFQTLLPSYFNNTYCSDM